MNEDTANRIVQLLQSIDEKLERLDQIEDLLQEIKMDVSGFEHEGQRYPGSSEKIVSAIESVESELNSMGMTLDSIAANTSE